MVTQEKKGGGSYFILHLQCPPQSLQRLDSASQSLQIGGNKMATQRAVVFFAKVSSRKPEVPVCQDYSQ